MSSIKPHQSPGSSKRMSWTSLRLPDYVEPPKRRLMPLSFQHEVISMVDIWFSSLTINDMCDGSSPAPGKKIGRLPALGARCLHWPGLECDLAKKPFATVQGEMGRSLFPSNAICSQSALGSFVSDQRWEDLSRCEHVKTRRSLSMEIVAQSLLAHKLFALSLNFKTLKIRLHGSIVSFEFVFLQVIENARNASAVVISRIKPLGHLLISWEWSPFCLKNMKLPKKSICSPVLQSEWWFVFSGRSKTARGTRTEAAHGPASALHLQNGIDQARSWDVFPT